MGGRVVDLNSKNGTRVGWEGVQTHVLRDGDHLRMGSHALVYCTGPFEPGRRARRNESNRPPQPTARGPDRTVTDFVLMEEEAPALDHISMGARPHPQRRAAEPSPNSSPRRRHIIKATSHRASGTAGRRNRSQRGPRSSPHPRRHRQSRSRVSWPSRFIARFQRPRA